MQQAKLKKCDFISRLTLLLWNNLLLHRCKLLLLHHERFHIPKNQAFSRIDVHLPSLLISNLCLAASSSIYSSRRVPLATSTRVHTTLQFPCPPAAVQESPVPTTLKTFSLNPTTCAPNITTPISNTSPYFMLWPQLQRFGQLPVRNRWSWKLSNFWAHLPCFLVELLHFVQKNIFWSKVGTIPGKCSLSGVTPRHSCPYQFN